MSPPSPTPPPRRTALTLKTATAPVPGASASTVPSASAPASADKPSSTTAATSPAPTDSGSAPSTPRSGNVGLIVTMLVLSLVAGGLVYFFGIRPRQADSKSLDVEQKLSTQRNVIYSTARFAAPTVQLPLPGTIEAFQQASIFARTNGYVKRWTADIGDVVKQGDLIAELDTPDVDQQLNQAIATSERNKSTLAIAQTTAERWNEMVKQNAVSKQEADEKNATRDEAKAALDASLADVARLTELKNFKEIRAPFTGTITYRNIEVGNLVSAGNGTGASNSGSTEMFRVAQTDPLKIYINVPESNSRAIHPGVKATIHVAAYPERDFHGEVVRSAGALDIASRTLRTEVDVPNKDAALLPGAYADVHLELTDDKPTVLVPANTLIVNSAGTQVALLEPLPGGNQDLYKVHLLPVRVGRDFGTEVEVQRNDQSSYNVKEGDLLITNPPADLADGASVIAKPKPLTTAPVPVPVLGPGPEPRRS